MSRVSAGRSAENLAAIFLTTIGYRVIGRNIRTPFGELDIVCLDDKTVVCVEVKSVAQYRIEGVEQLTPTKIRHLRSCLEYLKTNRFRHKDVRLDAVIVQTGKIQKHLQNIEMPW